MLKRSKMIVCAASLIAVLAMASGCEAQNEKAVPTNSFVQISEQVDYLKAETKKEFDLRMQWWRQGRFGLFIHWGLYAIPEGEWNGNKGHAEWILTTAQIPVSEYEQFAPQFNPIRFNAADWVRMTKDAGMKYIVITSKHHDGFCLYDSDATEYDVINATPFKRDILKELTEECKKQGIRMCFYYSIMDWHHPDYLPRRNWEDRTADGADYKRYIDYMTQQVTELVTRYGPHILWFDGEWEKTWSHEEGVKLYNHIRNLKPDIIINNRIDTGRGGMGGIHDARKYAGDFGTPEQEIPETGIKEYDWETCMTMNRHWGWNKYDKDFKSTEDLICKLVDIASKGGNFLLNIGPKPDGTFPQDSIDRLATIGQWMKVNGDSVYGTTATRFEHLEWGRSTTKGSTLYLHVFDWPADNKITLPGLTTEATKVYPLAEPDKQLSTEYISGSATITLPGEQIDPVNTVIAMEFKENPVIVKTPELTGPERFYPDCEVKINCGSENVSIHYTADGSEPTMQSEKYSAPIRLAKTTTIKCRVFKGSTPLMATAEKEYIRLVAKDAKKGLSLKPRLKYVVYHGKWNKIPDYINLVSVKSGITNNFDISVRDIDEFLSIVYEGYITVDKEGLYIFSLDSDDGSRLYIDDEIVVDNDGLHAPTAKQGSVALKTGAHSIRVEFLQGEGGIMLDANYTPPGSDSQKIPASILHHIPL
ncbi:MAG: alpha-L-fucosidase [Planctomycetota bacterium]